MDTWAVLVYIEKGDTQSPTRHTWSPTRHTQSPVKHTHSPTRHTCSPRQRSLIHLTSSHWANGQSSKSSDLPIPIDLNSHYEISPGAKIKYIDPMVTHSGHPCCQFTLTQWSLIQVTPALQLNTSTQWSFIQVTPAVNLHWPNGHSFTQLTLTQWSLIQVTPAVNLHWPNGHSFRSLLQFN